MVDAGFKFVKILQLLCDTRISFCGTEFTTVLMFINELWNSRSFVPLMVGVYESSFRQLKLIRLMNSRIWKLDDITHMMTFSSNFWFETKYESYYLTPIWWLLFNESAWRHEISRTSSLKSILNLICTFSIIYFNFTLSISDERFNWKIFRRCSYREWWNYQPRGWSWNPRMIVFDRGRSCGKNAWRRSYSKVSLLWAWLISGIRVVFS